MWTVIQKLARSLRILCALHGISLILLLLQLSPGGFPQSFDEVVWRVEDPNFYLGVWFPLFVVACFFPIIGFAGSFYIVKPAIWAYVAFNTMDIGKLAVVAESRS